MAESPGTWERRVLKTWLKHAGRLVLTVVVTWFILDRVGLGLEEVRALDMTPFMSPSLLTLLGASVLLLLMYFATAGLWGQIVKDLGGPTVPGAVSVRLFMVANLGRYIPGKVWQIAGLAALAKRRGVPATTATGAAVLGQGLALVAATGIGLGALLTAPEPYRQQGVVAAGALAFVLVLGTVPPVFDALVSLWFRVTRTEAPDGLGAVHGLRWIGLSVLIWAGYALSFWIFVTSFGASAPLVPTASAFAAAYVLGYLAFFSVAGVGVREGFLVVFLTPQLGVAAATAVAVLARLWTTVVEVVPAAAFWFTHVRGGGATGEGSDDG